MEPREKSFPQGLKPIDSQALDVGAKAPTPGAPKHFGQDKNSVLWGTQAIHILVERLALLHAKT
jgi:hypothetical protein